MPSKIDILFVHPNAAKKIYQGLSHLSAIEPPVWALMLSKHCKTKGFSTALLDCEADNLSHEESVKHVKDINPRLVCFCVYGQQPSASTQNMQGATELASLLKNTYPEFPIMFIGNHVSALPWEVIELPYVDFIAQNEGVYTVSNLLATDLKTDLVKVSGLGWKDETARLNPGMSIIPQEELENDLPGIDWDLYDEKKYRTANWHTNFKGNESPFGAIYTSLGCIFKCSFCLEENTNIITSNGTNKKAKYITKKDKLVAFDENTQQVVETEIQEISTRIVTELYNIKLSDGKYIRCTGEHPIYINGKYIPAKDVRIGDKSLVIDFQDKIKLQKQLYNPNKSNKLPKIKKTKEQIRAEASHRMTINNPMHQSEIRNAATATYKRKYENGEITPYLCTIEGKKIISDIARQRMLSDQNPSYKLENRLQASERWSGNNNYNWQDKNSSKKYSFGYTKQLITEIRERDNWQCRECGCKRRLHTHHIDYTKTNHIQCNLITLCISCHMKTNYNRDYWQARYIEMNKQYENCPHYTEVTSVIIETGNFTVYNYHCEPYNNYFANYILTHNCMINILNRTEQGGLISSQDSPIFRYWEPEFIIKEFDEFAKRGIKNIKIIDEMYVLKPKHFLRLSELLTERDYGFNIWCYARIDTIKERYLDTLKKAGVNWVGLGIEAANRNIRQEVTKGKFEDIDIQDIVGLVRRYNINVGANYIFGLPEETYETMQETLNLALEMNTEYANMYCAMAYPGSPLYIEAKHENIPLPQTYDGYSQHSYNTFPLPGKYLTNSEILKFRDNAWNQYFTNPAYLNMMEAKFGKETKENIEQLTKIKLRRRLLDD